MNNIYDEEYFKWQRSIGEFGGKANLFKFQKYINDSADILDFGCGGGYLLKNINTSGKKIGVEINPAARAQAEDNGVECYRDLSQIDDNSVDIIISNHALEHVEFPPDVLREFRRILRNDGRIVVVVPHEYSREVSLSDHNMHLYTWTPQNMVNLFKVCDIRIIDYGSICHMWMPHYQKIQQILGWKVFHKLCRLYCFIKKTGYQTFVAGTVKK